MNVCETKQIYTIILYKIAMHYDIPWWRFFRNSYQMTSPYVLFFSELCVQGIHFPIVSERKCKTTSDICLELRLHSLYGCQGLLNSQLSKKAKRDITQMAKMTRIISHKWSRISKKKCCVHTACTYSLTTFGLPAFDKLFIIHFSSSWTSFCPFRVYITNGWSDLDQTYS